MSDDGSGGACADGAALNGVFGLAASPDGKNLYAASTNTWAVTVLGRDKKTGALSQPAGTAACVSETGSGGDCVDGQGLSGAISVTVSPDGKNVYVTANGSPGIAAFTRDKGTGALTQLPGAAGCVNEAGTDGCTDGVGLNLADAVTVSPDGRNAYVAALGSDAVAAFARNPATGALTQLAGTAACVSEDGSGGSCADGFGLDGAVSVAVSPDGKNAYVAAQNSDAITEFARNKSTGALTQLPASACISDTGNGGSCVDGTALDGAGAVAVSGDGKNVYVASGDSDAIAAFSRNKKDGSLTQLAGTAACVSDTGAGGCADGTALVHPIFLAVTPDGKNVYVASYFSNAIAVFSRDRKKGSLTQLPGTAGCVSDNGSGGACTDGVALGFVHGLAVVPNGANVYAAAYFNSAVDAFTRKKK
jgi:6-phosphogluconolactonase (cycloisomerase 2 family)